MTTAIATTTQTLDVTEVTDIVVSTTEQDPITGEYARLIQIFGTPEQVSDNITSVLVLQVRVKSLTRVALELTAPTQQF